MLQMQLSVQAKKLVSEKLKDHEKRLIHTLGVCEMAELLAVRYDVDIEKAKIAALMHDYSKYDNPKECSDMLTEDEKLECEKYPFLYHAYLSAYNYKKLFPYDEDIFNAIHNHVFGRVGMSKLEEIIMIADFTEKNRTYDACIKCRKILLDGDINKAIYESLLATTSHCEDNGDKPHPEQLKVLEYYKEKIR